MSRKVVFESFSRVSQRAVREQVRAYGSIYVLEPFVSQHKRGNRFADFPSFFPDYIDILMQKGQIRVIPADSIEAKTIYSDAADQAVEAVEKVYPRYKEQKKDFIEGMKRLFKDPAIEDAFKKELSGKLAEFYAQNRVLSRVSQYFKGEQIIFFPDMPIIQYRMMESLVAESQESYIPYQGVELTELPGLKLFLRDSCRCGGLYLLPIFQLVFSVLLGWVEYLPRRKRFYRYGVSLVSPRQLEHRGRSPIFFVDGDKIRAEEVLCVSYFPLTRAQKIYLQKMGLAVKALPRPGQVFLSPGLWLEFFKLILRVRNNVDFGELFLGFKLIFASLKWEKFLRSYSFKHFITHCDFGVQHIARHKVFQKNGVVSWYFTDSMNMGCNYRVDGSHQRRHPYWTYLTYDHFVTWNQFLSDFFSSHPHRFAHRHIVGCLWSSYRMSDEASQDLARKNFFVIGVFDTTYSFNGYADYHEGKVFAEHLLQLADKHDRTLILLKQKKDYSLHRHFADKKGEALKVAYRQLSEHPRIKLLPSSDDPVFVIHSSHMVISFPFTSPTYEALCIHKPAIWHDPEGLYRGMVYDQKSRVVTHSFEELMNKVQQVQEGHWMDPFPAHSSLIDSYQDGKAIERFREMLVEND